MTPSDAARPPSTAGAPSDPGPGPDPDDAPVLPDRSDDDRDVGWGSDAGADAERDVRWYEDQRPPHWE